MKAIDTTKITEMSVRDYDLEKKILKTILVDKKNLEYINTLEDDDFCNDGFREIYRTFKEMFNNDMPISIELIPRDIKSSQPFTEMIVIESLFNWELPTYINRLKQISQQRKIQHLALKATTMVKEDKTPAEIACFYQMNFPNLVFKSVEDIQKQNLRINSELFEELQKEDYFGLTSGYHTLDYRIRGFANGTFIILGGTPSAGKTTWLLNIVNHLCKKGKRVLHINLEMSHMMLQMKILSIITGISTSVLMATKKNISEDQWKQITDTLNTIATYKWFRIGEKDTTVYDIENAIKEQGGFDIVIVDYLQLMSPVSKSKSRYEDVSGISRNLKKLSTKYNIPFIVVASINRDYANREDKMPMISDLRDSGNIEYDADLILFLSRESLFAEYDDRKHQMTSFEYEHRAELLVAKNRWGASNKKIPFFFDGEKSLFKEVIDEIT
jgi:replicative DNA helicase